MVVAALYRYHQDFVISIIDTLLERITLGLELNDFKYNQRRIAEVKYLAELYNYKMVDSPVIFDTMYRIVTFGHRKSTQCIINPSLSTSSQWHTHARTAQSARYAGRFLSNPPCLQHP